MKGCREGRLERGIGLVLPIALVCIISSGVLSILLTPILPCACNLVMMSLKTVALTCAAEQGGRSGR